MKSLKMILGIAYSLLALSCTEKGKEKVPELNQSPQAEESNPPVMEEATTPTCNLPSSAIFCNEDPFYAKTCSILLQGTV
jgi:hypothetical protein